MAHLDFGSWRRK